MENMSIDIEFWGQSQAPQNGAQGLTSGTKVAPQSTPSTNVMVTQVDITIISQDVPQL